jgi:hypothetical protein
MEAQPSNSRADLVEVLRVWILGVLGLGLLGTVTELILLGHYEQPTQLVPVVLIVLAIAALAWQFFQRDTASLKALIVIMSLCVLAGFAGFVAHFHGSAEFQLDLDPNIGSWELFQKVLHAKAPPLLAPGMMMQLGLLGLAYVFSDVRYRASVLGVFKLSSQKET